MKVDILAIGAHPDDVELGCGGTVAKLISEGKTVAIVDLTQGELGTRGTNFTRAEEAANSAKILGISSRENLKMTQLELATKIDKKRSFISKVENDSENITLKTLFDIVERGLGGKLRIDVQF